MGVASSTTSPVSTDHLLLEPVTGLLVNHVEAGFGRRRRRRIEDDRTGNEGKLQRPFPIGACSHYNLPAIRDWLEIDGTSATVAGFGSERHISAGLLEFRGFAVSLRDLTTYRKKRDFEKTAEPSGETPIRPSKQRRFVIQKHAATRLHYDLRLEFDGVFKSWAITRGPSLDPHDKRLAVEVEDHPLDYGDFEGTIPKGQYGGGTVQLWDRGYWQPEGDRSPLQMLRNGSLRFRLEGKRLKGEWVLVRLRDDRSNGRRHNWLLIKHHDAFDHAGDGNGAVAEDRSVASGRTMADIAAGKGRKPRPFMLKDSHYQSDAVWNSNRDEETSVLSPARTTAAAPKRQRLSSGKRTVRGAAQESRAPVVMGVTISNPDKALWPATAGTAAIT